MGRKTEKSGIIRAETRESWIFPKAPDQLCSPLYTGVLSLRAPEANALLHLVPDKKIRVATTELLIN